MVHPGLPVPATVRVTLPVVTPSPCGRCAALPGSLVPPARMIVARAAAAVAGEGRRRAVDVDVPPNWVARHAIADLHDVNFRITVIEVEAQRPVARRIDSGRL